MKDRLDLLLTSWMKQHPVSAAQAKLLQLLLISAVTWTGRNPQALLMLAWSVTHLSSATSSLPQKPLRTRWESWRHMSVQTIQEEGQNSDLDCSRAYVRKRFLNAARDPYHLVILSSRNFLRAAASLATTLTDLSVRSVFLTDSLLLKAPSEIKNVSSHLNTVILWKCLQDSFTSKPEINWLKTFELFFVVSQHC